MPVVAGAEPQRYGRAWWRRHLRRAAPLVALLAAAVVVAVVVTPEPDSGLPLDPGSPQPDGTRALVDVLRGLGREVSVVAPDQVAGAPVVLLLHDQLTDDERAALVRGVERGARLVVTDPNSALAPDVSAALTMLEPGLERGCRLRALRDAQSVRPDGGVRYEVPAGAQGCFDGGEDGSWLVVQPRGRGHVIALGGPGFLTNWGLAQADNAVLAVHLLTPDGTDRTEIVRPVLGGPADAGGTSVVDYIPDPVLAAIWQVLIGFLVVVAWRARRLGTPLIEHAPVKLASSDLTAAVGVLLARNDTRAATLQRLVDDTRVRLARRLGLPDATDSDVLIDNLTARTSLSATDIARVLQPPPPTSDEALLRATIALADLEHAVHAGLAATSWAPVARHTRRTGSAGHDTLEENDVR